MPCAYGNESGEQPLSSRSREVYLAAVTAFVTWLGQRDAGPSNPGTANARNTTDMGAGAIANNRGAGNAPEPEHSVPRPTTRRCSSRSGAGAATAATSRSVSRPVENWPLGAGRRLTPLVVAVCVAEASPEGKP